MTLKRTCDCCGKDDIGRSYTNDRLRTKIGNVECEVMVAVDGVWNGGDLCYECLVAHMHTAFSAGEGSEAQIEGDACSIRSMRDARPGNDAPDAR